MLKRLFLFSKITLLALLLVGAFFGAAEPALAQAQDNLDTVSEAAGIDGDQDIRIIIARIINITLSFLGIIAVIIVIYGGFTWMTSAGNAEKLERAKRILINGLIGLTIIFMSWAITAFVLSALTGATGVGGGSGSDSSGGGGTFNGGGGSSSFVIADVVPQGDLLIRNVIVQSTFTRAIDAETVSTDSFSVIRVSDGIPVVGELEVSGNSIDFTPEAACPDPNSDRNCFDANTEYQIRITSALESTSGVNLLECLTTCTFNFTTGEVVDVDDPDVSITVPDNGDGFPVGDIVGIQAAATDDFYVGAGDFFVEDIFFDSVIGTGADPADVTMDTIWDTLDPVATTVGESYTLEVRVTDLAGNTATDSISVDGTPAYCFNGVLDDGEVPPEEGVDCGGLCGACDGASCTTDADCAGSCVNGFCVSAPEISDVLPRDGAVGTYVTILGTHFGGVTGTVYFSDGAGGRVEAIFPACADAWSDDQIIVEVPAGAQDGPITVETSAGITDLTNDDAGAIIEDFDVNDVVRPNLCKLSPDDGGVGTFLDAIGAGFGAEQGDSVAVFTPGETGTTTDVRTYNDWNDSNIELVVPALQENDYLVEVVVDGVSSNALQFELNEDDAAAPAISSVNPENGGVGQYITITGNDFGGSIGLVWFENLVDGTQTIADTTFPDACGTDYWDPDQVTVKVPDVALGDYNIFIERASDTRQSNRVDFAVTSADPTPGVCALLPDEGAIGDEVRIIGENFGSSAGSVAFFNEAPATIASWDGEEIVVSVPASASTGPVDVTASSGDESNALNFELTGESSGATADVGAAYAWRFSTGQIPITPRLVQECTASSVSAVPSDRYNDAVCVNAVVYGYFDTLMDEGSIDTSSVLLEQCNNDSCSNTTAVPADVSVSSAADTTQFHLRPTTDTGRLLISTKYQVTVTTGVESLDGTPMDNPVSWTFTTSDDPADCDVEEVVVQPSSEVLTAEGMMAEFNALPKADNCTVLDATDYSWNWSLDESIAGISETCTDIVGDSCVVTEALIEGDTLLRAQTVGGGVEGSADLIVNFTDPYVDNFWPNCSTACVNADIGASFNIAMDPSVIEASNRVQLYSCETEFCSNLTLVSNTASCVDEGEGCARVSVDLPDGFTLDPQTYYRVVISGAVMSESGVALTRVNYGDDFSWTFLTRADGSICSVERIELEPENAILMTVGETQQFAATPYGAPDSCSVAGQRLNGYDFSWNWTNPIDDSSSDDANLASWVNLDGSLIDTDQDEIPAGCSGSCLPQGSSEVLALCGNGILEVGEDCDDGNTLSGDTCSPSCEFEGSNTCSQACTTSGLICSTNEDCDVDGGETCSIFGTGCCGDGVVTGGEECDDGNVQNGDGCSAICLNEGSLAAGVTCGDGIVSGLPGSGGEECDDGNKANGDGCSAVCLNEGSTSVSDVAAICGNGVIETPYETCDDGNVLNGDGCSSRCLREGISSSLSTGFVCGNGVIEQVPGTSAGEDCDGEAGCTSECLLAGSSLAYASPSVCGDGIVGTGELAICEVGAVGDGDIDPIQLAQIDDDAAASVDESGEATQVVEVSLNDLTTTSDLTLLCSAESDDDCPAGFGADDNGCCSAYPSIELFPNSPDVCRNAGIHMISDKRMDVASFTNNAYVRLDEAVACPANHIVFTEDTTAVSWLWDRFKSLFVLAANAQVDGDCLVPISAFEQTSMEDGRYKISFKTGALLRENSAYSIVVEDGAEGILTNTGVVLSSSETQPFITGSEICELDIVSIVDQTGDVPGLFTRFDDDHDMLAVPYTLKGALREEIQPVPGVYDWNWQDWEEDSAGTIFDVSVPNPARPDISEVSPEGVNGEATLIAQAQVIEEGVVSDSVVSGDLDLVALLCENPWPSADLFPFEDSAQGNARGIPGLSASPAWMHFSSYYCRDRVDASLLPELSVVAATDPATEEVIKEYFFAVGGTTDVIGIRIASNPDYLSPLAWYQQQGFNGSPSATSVDGFEAVEDGRTIYVAAPNENKDVWELYSNIYVISYNEGASEETISIYDQMLANWSFATNVENVSLCRTSSGNFTSRTCSSDLDCAVEAGEICANNKDKLARDTKRLSDLRSIQSNLFTYAVENQRCSATTNQLCSFDADCPAGESCLASFPELASGTFVRSISSSNWDSWEANLSSLIGDAPVDPLGRYYGCGSICSNTREACTTNADCTVGTETGTCLAMANVDHEANTCVNQDQGEYVCPAQSHAYHYRSQGPFGYELTAELEYGYEESSKSRWINPIDTNVADDLDITIGGAFVGSGAGFQSAPAFCDGSTYGDSSTCGDGIVGGSEVCEIGQKGLGASCDANGDGVDDGFRATVCNATCSGFETSDGAECVAYSCGNGVVDPGESCDDGSFNGSYGFCNGDCSGFDFFCGDGSIAGGETCDCSTSGATGLTSGGGSCTVSNGVYAANPGNTCAYDCGGAGPHCGDGIIQSGEQCDGNVQTYEGTYCSSGLAEGLPCSSNADCPFGLCGISAPSQACPNTTVCIGGGNQGFACSNDGDCPGSQCSTFTVQTTRTRTCADNGAAGEVCNWNDPRWSTVDCKAPGTCGNGTLDEGEECDDGNDDDTDSCTSLCTLNVCGDGFLYDGVEQCDEAENNGIVCSAAYESTCTYCSSSCRVLSSSGAFCGDGVIGGGEICDAGDLSYRYASVNGLDPRDNNVGDYCDAGQEGQTQSGMECQNWGVCNGGTLTIPSDGEISMNGLPCEGSSACGVGGECVFAQCALSCEAQCPFDYDNTELTFLDNQIGATRSTTVDLLSSEEAAELDVLGDPTAATIFVPACRIAKDLTIDIDDSLREFPTVEIMFVLDTSWTMDDDVSGGSGTPTRLEILQGSVLEAVDDLYDAYNVSLGGNLKVGAAYIGGSHFNDPNVRFVPSSGSDSKVEIAPSTNEALVRSTIEDMLDATTVDIGTPVHRSIRESYEAFSDGDDEADERIMIIFTDGNIYNSENEYDSYGLYESYVDTNGNGEMDADEYMRSVSSLIDEMKDDNVQVYSAVLTTNSCDITQMQRWSSMDCFDSGSSCPARSVEGNHSCSEPENGLTYAYEASTEEGFEDMFQQIVDSILNITITLDDGDETSAIELEAGVGSSIQIPSSFACDGVSEKEITIRASFLDQGGGRITLSNPRVNMCSP